MARPTKKALIEEARERGLEVSEDDHYNDIRDALLTTPESEEDDPEDFAHEEPPAVEVTMEEDVAPPAPVSSGEITSRDDGEPTSSGWGPLGQWVGRSR